MYITVTLNKITQVVSEVDKALMNISQLLSNSEAGLVAIIERNEKFHNISRIVNQTLDDAKTKFDYSWLFLHNRTLEDISVNNISKQLKTLQEILQDKHSLLSNVSTEINNTIIYNRHNNITRLQVLYI